jgi:hypothetical protein
MEAACLQEQGRPGEGLVALVIYILITNDDRVAPVSNEDLDRSILRELADKEAIRTVLAKYCRAVDRGDVELLESVFHPDAIHDHGEFRGPHGEPGDGFSMWAVSKGNKMVETIQHSLGTVFIELDGDVAFVESYFLSPSVLQERTDDEQMMTLLIGRYLDRFERRGGEWRIAYRAVAKDLRDVHPLHDVDEPYTRARRGPEDLLYQVLDGKSPF